MRKDLFAKQPKYNFWSVYNSNTIYYKKTIFHLGNACRGRNLTKFHIVRLANSDLKLVNFYKHLKEEDFPIWGAFEIAYDNWIHSMTIEKSGQRHLSFFDKETFSFKDLVPEEFVATEIELKHN